MPNQLAWWYHRHVYRLGLSSPGMTVHKLCQRGHIGKALGARVWQVLADLESSYSPSHCTGVDA